MASTLSVPFTIVEDGIDEAYPGPEGPVARVTFRCAWDDRYRLVADLIGSSQLVRPPSGPPAILRTFPFAYPPSPNLFCRSIESIKPFGKPKMLPYPPANTWLTRQQADVTARFEALKYSESESSDPSGQPYTTTSLNISGEVMTIPTSAFTFAGGVPTNTPIGIIIPQNQISFKRHTLPYLPIMEMLTITGAINQFPFTVGDFTCPIGTLLFLGGPSQITMDTLGNILQEVEYQFIYRPIPWNFYLHPNPAKGFQPVFNKAGAGPYPLADFSILP